MKDRVIMERAGIVAVAYGLALAAHVELPGVVPFGAFLAALAGASALVLASNGRGASPASRGARASRGVRAVRGASVAARPGAVAAGFRGLPGTGANAAPRPESGDLGAMRAALRRLEGEVHALEDQRLTELARTGGHAREALR